MRKYRKKYKNMPISTSIQKINNKIFSVLKYYECERQFTETERLIAEKGIDDLINNNPFLVIKNGINILKYSHENIIKLVNSEKFNFDPPKEFIELINNNSFCDWQKEKIIFEFACSRNYAFLEDRNIEKLIKIIENNDDKFIQFIVSNPHVINYEYFNQSSKIQIPQKIKNIFYAMETYKKAFLIESLDSISFRNDYLNLCSTDNILLDNEAFNCLINKLDYCSVFLYLQKYNFPTPEYIIIKLYNAYKSIFTATVNGVLKEDEYMVDYVIEPYRGIIKRYIKEDC